MGFDIETSGLSLIHDRVRLVQFGDAMHGWALPWEDWRGAVREVLEQYDRPIAGFHTKFDAGFMQREGIKFPWERTHDPMFMCHLTNSLGPKSLKAGSRLYVSPDATAGQNLLQREMTKHRWSWATVPVYLPLYWGYGAMDTVLTARLAENLWPGIQPYREAYDLELACQRVLCDLELRGVRIDVPYCGEQLVALTARLEEIRARLGDISPTAPRQVIGALLDQGAPMTKRTEKSGQLAVDDEVLSGLRDMGYELAGLVLEARSLAKIISSYFANFLEYHRDGILQPHVNQIAARTGRMSVTEPALQTLPRTSLVRNAFIPRDGSSLVLVDYDNQELRVAAHFSQDEAMLAAFREGRDLHGETARRLYGENYTREQRGRGKNGMFAKAYGAGGPKFAQAVGLPQQESDFLYYALDRAYPGLSRAMARATNLVRERAGEGASGWVQLIDGRRLYVSADKPYVGFNALIQGSCAVVLKRALVDLDLAGLGEFIVLPVHDEIVFDVPTDQLDAVVPEIVRTMTREDFSAPLTVGAKIVDRWGDAYADAA